MTRNANSRPRLRKPRGSFADLESLLEHLGRPAIIELGDPLPQEQFLPRRKRNGLTPTQINQQLLDRASNDGDHGSI